MATGFTEPVGSRSSGTRLVPARPAADGSPQASASVG